MNLKDKKDRHWLLETAQLVADALRARREGTSLRIHRPKKAHKSDTDGWAIVIGGLGKGRPGLEIWLDRFTRHPERKFYASFYSKNEKKIQSLAYCSKSLWPIRKMTDEDFIDSSVSMMKTKLRLGEFNEPVLENYRTLGHHFFGFYDLTTGAAENAAERFCESAVAFFLDVANSLPASISEKAKRKIEPQNERKKWVKAHLGRERSRYLALECKRRDYYECRVCKMTFSAVYGSELGDGFAEAHHVRPLAGAPKNAKTNLEDLITVCSNCHRMLHRMDDDPGDVMRLRRMVRKHRS